MAGFIYLRKTVHRPSCVAAEGQRKPNKVGGVRKITEVIGTEETRLSIRRKWEQRDKSS